MTARLPSGVMWDIKVSHYLRKRPERPFALLLAGWVALSLGDTDAAGRYFDTILTKNGDYSQAYTGKICVALSSGRFREAAAIFLRESGGKALTGYVGRFRFYSAVSVCALAMLKSRQASRRAGPGPLGALRYAVYDGTGGERRLLKAAEGKTDGRDGARGHIRDALLFVRYVELLWRGGADAGELAQAVGAVAGGGFDAGMPFRSHADGSRRADVAGSRGENTRVRERRRLAGELSALPGLCDEFRLLLLADASGDAGTAAYTFDEPALLGGPLLNRLFKGMLLAGQLGGPRAILGRLRKDEADLRLIACENRWLFLKLCDNMRRDGDLERETAWTLERDGWWADPLVRRFLI